jgi:hypothetical protein
MKRKEFFKTGLMLIGGFAVSSKTKFLNAAESASIFAKDYKTKIIEIIKTLKEEGTNLVVKIMNGKEYEFDPYVHYPFDGGIKDVQTGYQLFFHAHREDEYGHFHTFATDEDGELVHLALISMNKSGELIGLSTVNRWVTGDKYVKADKLKKLSSGFYMNPSLYKDSRVIEFVNNVFKAYQNELNDIFDERDVWIKNYAAKYYREPFEDRHYEILSDTKINLFNHNK